MSTCYFQALVLRYEGSSATTDGKKKCPGLDSHKSKRCKQAQGKQPQCHGLNKHTYYATMTNALHRLLLSQALHS